MMGHKDEVVVNFEDSNKPCGESMQYPDLETADSVPSGAVQKESYELREPASLAAQKKRYLRKLNWIILPTISLLYFFEYLDRGNVAVSGTAVPVTNENCTLITPRQNAKLYGLDAGRDTEKGGIGSGLKSLSATEWQLTIMIFYVGLVLCQVPGCIGYRIFSPSRVRTQTYPSPRRNP